MLFSSVTKNKRAISKIKKQESASWLYSFLLLVFSFLSVVSLTYAATTIGNNIFTSGTITSQGKAYLTGGVSTPVLNATSSLIDNLKVTQNALLSQATIPTLNSTSSLIDNLKVKVNLAVQGLTQLATTTSFNINKVVIVDGKHYPANSTGIQEAIDSLGPEGGKVFLPAGTYPITATTTLPSNVWLQGAGASSTILYLANNANTTILTNSDPVNGNSHIKISDLMVYGNKINNTHSDNNGILFTNVTNSKIVDNRVKDCHNAGIFINPGSNNVIERNEINDNGAGVAIHQGNSLENAIVGNKIEGNSAVGIGLYESGHSLVKSNFIEKNGGNFYVNSHGGIILNLTTNNFIIGNEILDNILNNIYVDHATNNIITNNIVCLGFNDNIVLEVTNSNIISSNKICSAQYYYGININFDQNSIINGNNFYGQRLDLYLGVLNYHEVISGNHFSDPIKENDGAYASKPIYAAQPLSNDNIILKSIGNVGIGTVNPLTRLSVLKADTASSSLTTLLSLSHTASGGYGHPGIGSGLSFINQSTLGDSTTTAEIASIYNASSTAPEGNLTFFTKNSLLPPQERMVITSQGNVGIGTTTPTEKLEVNGNAYFQGKVTSTSIALPEVKFIPTATPTNPKIGQCFMDNGAKPQVSCYDGAAWHTLW